MLFSFLKYVQPVNYFHLKNKNKEYIFPKIENLPTSIKDKLDKETRYISEFSVEYDLSWQAIQKGYIGETTTYKAYKELPLVDEYLFVRKYFNKIWATYILFIRIITFKNISKEIVAWQRSKKAIKSNYLSNPLRYPEWTSYDSNLIKEKPKVSIIIPTLNRYSYLKDVLTDLEAQDYDNFEVIIIDQSEPYNEHFYSDFNLNSITMYQEEKALWLARNSAVKLSKSNFILLFDDDSRVEPNWISNHLKCLDFFNADISSGVSISTIGAEVPKNYSFFRISDQLDTGNTMLRKKVFFDIGLFDRQFEKQRMGDGEFGLRSFLYGHKNISNPYAKRIHLKVGSGGLREMGSWDGFRPKKIFSPRPIPSVIYLTRKYFGNAQAKLLVLKSVPPSIIPYRFKKNKKMMALGFFISIFIFPIILIQVLLSWRLANKKLKQGAIIEMMP